MAAKKSSASKKSSADSSTATKKQRDELGAPEGADVGNIKPIEDTTDDTPDLTPKLVKDPSNREAVGPVIESDAEHVVTNDTTKPESNNLQSVYVQPKGK